MDNKHENSLILLIEDDKYLNETIQEVLENEGYEIESGESAKDAINHINHNGKQYDLLLLDYNLNDRKGVNGLDIFEMAKEINPGVKCVIISAYGEKFIREKCFSKGIHKFIDKPFLISDLIDSVHTLVHEHTGENEYQKKWTWNKNKLN